MRRLLAVMLMTLACTSIGRLMITWPEAVRLCVSTMPLPSSTYPPLFTATENSTRPAGKSLYVERTVGPDGNAMPSPSAGTPTGSQLLGLDQRLLAAPVQV